MHNEVFAKLRLDYCYMCYKVDHENLGRKQYTCRRFKGNESKRMECLYA